MHWDFYDQSIEYLKGVGPKRAEVLQKELGIHTFGDLLFHFPFRYVDRSRFYTIREIDSDQVYFQLKGTITKLETIGKGRATRLAGTFSDGTGAIELVWFKGIKWIKEKIRPGVEYIVFGKPTLFNGRFNMPHPEIEEAKNDASDLGEAFQAVYSTTEKLRAKGLDSKGISKIMKNLVIRAQNSIPEILPNDILERFKLVSREQALINIHFPGEQNMIGRAQARLKFEELFMIQLRLMLQKQYRHKKIPGHLFTTVGDYFNSFYHKNLPFELTGAQKRVLKEIRADVGDGHQMNRLLQGDVGSGKTLVALMAMLIALDNGFQACLMVPTEILAVQHYNSINKLLAGMDIRVELLTGSTKNAERKGIHERLMDGSTHILIGTHALLEESVQLKNLGIVIIDEQHRFGVAQRAAMWSKNITPPHVLVMTATPIPRTMAMTVYGDLDISVIDEMPPSRKPVKTMLFTDSGRLRLFGFMREQIKAGRQVYMVYPLIYESEKLDLKHLMEGYDSIVREFPLPEYAVSMVHGQMKAADKDYEMQRFVKGQTQIMIATTVIEVGVDVPNASVMVIENAERFGLSQLHQLRGRVGRGADQSYCILMVSDKITHQGRKRLETMVRTNDGFEIAEADLKLRGPGDIEGTQQSGIVDLKLADLVRDEKILKVARNEAMELLNNDPDLIQPSHQKLLQELRKKAKSKKDWSKIS